MEENILRRQIQGFMENYPPGLEIAVKNKIINGLTKEEVTYFEQTILSNPKIVMSFLYIHTSIEDISLRDELLQFMIPGMYDKSLKEVFEEVERYEDEIIELSESIPGDKSKTPTIFHTKLNDLYDLFHQVIWGDRLFQQPKIKELSGMSISQIREWVLEKKPSYIKDKNEITEKIYRYPDYPPILQRITESSKEEKIENFITSTHGESGKEWEYRALEWLTENCQRFQFYPLIRNRLVIDTGGRGKSFSHWVILKHPNGKEIRFSMSLVGKLDSLVKIHFKKIWEMAYKKHGDILILVPEIIKKMKDLQFLDDMMDNKELVNRSGESHFGVPQSQKLLLTALVLYKLALECPKDVERIVGWYNKKIEFEAKRANQPELRAIRTNPLDQENLLRLDHPLTTERSSFKSEEETVDPYELISFSRYPEEEEDRIINKQTLELIISNILDPDEQTMLRDELDDISQKETAEKLGISESSLSKKKTAMKERLIKKYKNNI